MISLDCETTGLDLHHGAQPFFVTTCTESGDQRWWEWAVDPLTRKVQVIEEDKKEIQAILYIADSLVLQNAKFDASALATIGLTLPWEKVDDTLIMGHLLASNQPHDLTSMAMLYLGVDIEPLEKSLKVACDELRRLARSKYKEWRIAKQGLPEMPSAKESCWKYDTWLPLAMAKELDRPDDHPHRTVLRDYANADSAVTVALGREMKRHVEERELAAIYKARMRSIPIAQRMERHGVTLSAARLDKLMVEFKEESDKANRVCTSIAAGYGVELTLPKSGNNKSLLEFCFGEKGLQLDRIGQEEAFEYGKSRSSEVMGKTRRGVLYTENGTPSLNKVALEHYEATLPKRSKALTFIKSLKGKRKRDTSISYMESYQRFWIPLDVINELGERLWFRLHPSLNPTGTDTLRWSSSNPNEQNISKQEGFNIRYCFGPAPGREWWSLDAKNIELRLPAYASGEREIIALFESPDEPPYYGSTHLLNFHTVYPDLWEKELRDVGPDKVGPKCKKKYAATYYQWCKNGGFAVQYGAVYKDDGTGTADRAFHRPGSHARLKSRFSKLDALNRKCIAHAEKYGYVETMPDRSVDPKRGYPLMCTRTEWGKILPTVPLNYYIQGTAMWWTMMAMVAVQAQLDEWAPAFDGHIVMQVHDELVLDFPQRACPVKDPKRNNLGRIRAIQKLMEQGGVNLGVPTPVGCEYHADNWAEGTTL